MKIDIKCGNPTYTLELSQEEFLVLFEALGDRTIDQWDIYKERHNLTVNECKHLKDVSQEVYNKMDDTLLDFIKAPSSEFVLTDKWLANKYKESYKD